MHLPADIERERLDTHATNRDRLAAPGTLLRVAS